MANKMDEKDINKLDLKNWKQEKNSRQIHSLKLNRQYTTTFSFLEYRQFFPAKTDRKLFNT